MAVGCATPVEILWVAGGVPVWGGEAGIGVRVSGFVLSSQLAAALVGFILDGGMTGGGWGRKLNL